MKPDLITNPSQFFTGSDPILTHVQKNYYNRDFHPYRCAHCHDQLELLLFVKGDSEYLHNARKYRVIPGSIAICNRGTFHAENYPGMEGYFISIGITGLHIPGLKRDNLIPEYLSPIINTGNRFKEFCTIADMIMRVRKEKNSFSGENMKMLLKLLLLQVYEMAVLQSYDYARNAENIYVEENLMRKIRRYLEKNYREQLTIEQIASELQISPSRLTHSFKNFYRISVMQYVTWLRIGDAQSMLANTEIPITDISHQLGYNSSNSFYISFNRNVQMSPTDFRLKFREFNMGDFTNSNSMN